MPWADSRASKASPSFLSPAPTLCATHSWGGSSRPMRGRGNETPVMLEIALDAGEEWDSSRSWDQLVRGAAEAAIAESAFPQLTTSTRPIELSVRLSGDEDVRALNAEWRGKDKPTNVLSFPMADDHDLRGTNVADLELLLGDIILARGVCEGEAAEKGIPVDQHATHLIV